MRLCVVFISFKVCYSGWDPKEHQGYKVMMGLLYESELSYWLSLTRQIVHKLKKANGKRGEHRKEVGTIALGHRA